MSCLHFSGKKIPILKTLLESKAFVLMLAYLSDIFEALNNMNLFFQGPNSFIPDFISK